MNIGLIGSGGREHALCKKIHESKIMNKIFCFPGNAGTSKLATNVNVDILDFKKILTFIKILKIDLVIVGPEEPLVLGIVDYLVDKDKARYFPSWSEDIIVNHATPKAKEIIDDPSFFKIIFANNEFPIPICNIFLLIKLKLFFR